MKNQSEKGFTLMELILVMGIMSIVMAAIFSFLLFQNKMFNKASDKFDIQAETRLALSQIDKELRNSVTLVLIDRANLESDKATSPSTSRKYMVISTDGNVKIYTYDGINYVENIIGSHIINDSTKSYFQKINKNTLKVNISAANNSEAYTLDTEILLNNMTISGEIPNAIDHKEMAVKFTK